MKKKRKKKKKRRRRRRFQIVLYSGKTCDGHIIHHVSLSAASLSVSEVPFVKRGQPC